METLKVFFSRLKHAFQALFPIYLAFFITSLLCQTAGLLIVFDTHFFQNEFLIWSLSILNDSMILSLTSVFLVLIIMVFSERKWTMRLIHLLISFFLIFQLASLFYFNITLEPLGKTILAFDSDQMGMVAENFMIFEWHYLLLILPPFIYSFLKSKFKSIRTAYFSLPLILLPLLMISVFGLQFNEATNSYSTREVVQNKVYFFFNSVLEKSENTSTYDNAIIAYQSNENDKKFVDENYPLLHLAKNDNPLGPFFDLKQTPPNIVIILVESLSSSYSGVNADKLSFTPFLDSLSKSAIYFENFLATGERTFSVLPSCLSSLPHGSSGFTNTKNSFPEYTSFPKWLIENEYQGLFYYGGYARFDQMDLYMNNENFSYIFERKEYNYEGKDVQTSIDPVPFGVGDKELLSNVIKIKDSLNLASPTLDVILTLSMHYPFLIEDKEKYVAEAEQRILNSQIKEGLMQEELLKYLEPFATMLYTDDAIKTYFEERKKTLEHENTIYLILGDHMMGDIPQSSPIEKYRVPLIIYSPMLKRTKRIKAVNSQLDIAPSLMNLLKEKYPMSPPTEVSWIGSVLDTNRNFSSNSSVLFMRNNRSCSDFLSQNYFISEDQVFKVEDRLKLVKVDDYNRKNELSDLRSYYERVHSGVVQRNKLKPDNINYLPIAEQRNKLLNFSDQEEFVTIYKDSLSSDLGKIQLSFETELKNGWSSDLPEKEQPMLICALKRKDSLIYWSHISLNLQDILLEEKRIVTLNLNENLNLDIRKGDRLSLYFWNANIQNKEYSIIFKRLNIKALKD